MLIKLPALKPEIIFIIIGLIFGIAFTLINPIFQVPDEPAHYVKVLDLTYGIVFVDHSKIFVNLYSPIPYLIPTLAMLMGKLLGLSNLVQFYMGRLANLFFYLIVIFLAIKYTPVLKWVFVLLGLMPMAIYEAASFSSDGFNIAISFLLIAFILKLALDDKIVNINHGQILIIFMLGILLALSKEVYILLLFLYLIIPKQKFDNERIRYLCFIGIFLFSVIIALIWAILAKNIYVPISDYVSVIGQLEFILYHPISFMGVYINTILTNFTYYMITFVGSLVWTDVGIDTPLPPVLVCSFVILLFIAALTDSSDVNIELDHKLIFLLIFLTTFTSIFTMEYLMWTDVGKNVIDGVYGRYFIPIAPLLLLGVYNNRIKDFKGKNIILTVFILITLFVALFLIYNKFY